MKLLLVLATVLLLSLAVRSQEEKEACICDPEDDRTVCGANGVTYRNFCDANCEGVDVVNQGACNNHRFRRSSPSNGDK